MSLTRSEVRTQLGYLCPENPRSTEDTNTLINEVQKRVVQDTECLRQQNGISQSLTSGTSRYTITTPILRIVNINFYDTSESNYDELDIRSKTWLDKNKSGWRSTSNGTPIIIYFEGNIFGLYPPPDTTGDYVYGDIVPEPDNLTQDSHELFRLSSNPTYQIQRLSDMVVYLCAERLKRERNINKQADIYGKKYFNALKLTTSHIYQRFDAKRANKANIYNYAKKFLLH